MNRLLKVIGLAIILFLGGIGCAAADTITPGTFTLTPLMGGYWFEGNQDLDDDPLLGIGLGWDISRHFGVEAVANYVDTRDEVLGIDVDAYIYHLDGLFYFLPAERLVPYFAAGIGGISLDPEGAESDTEWQGNYGLGLKYFVTENLAARADVRHLISFDDDTFHNVAAALGVTFHFGGKRPVREARAEAPPPAAEPAPPAVAQAAPPQKDICVFLDVHFDFDRAEIKPAYHDDLRKIADFMKENPETSATVKGHADYIGTEEYNQQLSERRSQSIKNYLVENFDIEADRFTTVGYGEKRPVATNETDFGRELNRRATDVLCTFEITFR